MKKLLIFVLLSCIALGIFYHTKVTRGRIFSAGSLLTKETLALVPLDSRPPCTLFPAQLGALAGYRVETPPPSYMDFKRKPAQTEKVKQWLLKTLPTSDAALISSDLLTFGGLWQNRLAPLAPGEKEKFLTYLNTLQKNNPHKALYLYSIIPRMLVSDHLLPDSWYQWHLMQWSISMDRKLQGLPYNKAQYAELQKEIPLDLKVKYTNLYTKNAAFNQALFALAPKHPDLHVTIGQDDAMLFGLPNHNRLAAQKTMQRLGFPSNLNVTQGADEIGALAVAHLFLAKEHYRPKVFVAYSNESTKDMLLHFVPLTLEQIVADKLKLLPATLVATPSEADFILFVHCGDEGQASYLPVAQKLKSYMQHKPVALVDLAMNFLARESLIPTLLATNTPLPRLLSYAGWNTASNSIGTALAQAAIVTGQSKILPKAALPTLYAQNLTFTCERLLDDWAYQKKVRYKIKEWQELNGINTKNTAPHTKLVENYIARELYFYKLLLLYTNLRQHPFYQNKSAAYYLEDFTYEVSLPWERTFEIKLVLTPKFIKS